MAKIWKYTGVYEDRHIEFEVSDNLLGITITIGDSVCGITLDANDADDLRSEVYNMVRRLKKDENDR